MSWNPFSKKRTVLCPPDNRAIHLYKNSQDAFPLYTQDWSKKYKIAVDTATQLSGEIGGEFAKRINGLLILLNEANGSMQMKLCALYQYYSEEPCSREKWFQLKLEKTLDEVTLLQRAKFELEALEVIARSQSATGELIHHVDQMMERLKQNDDEISRRAAFSNASTFVDEWQR